MDLKWWEVHIDEVREKSLSELVTTSSQCTKYGIKRFSDEGRKFETYGNSGAAAVSLAHYMGSEKIILLGYDCQKSGTKVHWFGDHPRGLGNAGSLPKWPEQFRKLSEGVKGANVINCSRESALTVFKRSTLEDEL